MTRRRPDREEVDRLLREALVDDLSGDTEGRLRASMRPAWRRAVARVAAEESASRRGWAGAPASWSPQRVLLAAAALVALAVGGVVQLEAGAGPLADSLLAQQTAARVASQLQRVSAMVCRLEGRDSQGRLVRFVIDWRDSGETRVRIETPEATRYRTLHQPRETGSFLVLTREGLVPSASRLDDPDLNPVRALLTPDRVAGLLAGRWARIPVSAEVHAGEATFLVSSRGRREAAQVAIDTDTYLPLSVERLQPDPGSTAPGQPTWVRASLDWTLAPLPGPPKRLLNGRARSETTSDRFAGS